MVAEPGSRWNRAAPLLILSILTFFLQTTVMTAVPTLIDTKLLGRPKGYSGNRGEWNQFKFVFKAYVGAISTEMLRHLDTAERSVSAMPLSAFTAAEQTKARTLSYILAQILTCSSLQLLMNERLRSLATTCEE